MSTGKDYGLPAEYADWVEWYPTGTILPNPYATEAVRIATTKSMKIDGRWCDEATVIRHFVPPKPKPTLPEVGPGAVVRFTNRFQCTYRAIRRGNGWNTFSGNTDFGWLGDFELLNMVNDDGFIVELDGLA